MNYVLLILCFLKSVAPSKGNCLAPQEDITPFVNGAPFVVEGRFVSLIPVRNPRLINKFDLVYKVNVLVVGKLKYPNGYILPKRIVVGDLVIPGVNKSTDVSSNVASDQFGCIQSFKVNAKYTFMLKKSVLTEVSHFHFELVGPLLPSTEFNNQKILNILCKTCYTPKVSQFTPQLVKFGQNFNQSCLADGKPIPNVGWFKGDYPISSIHFAQNMRVEVIDIDENSRMAILEIFDVVLLDNGDYTCRASNTLGTVKSKLKLRVSKHGISQKEHDDALVARSLISCSKSDNFCMNDGQCFARKENHLYRTCICPEGFMGDQCQFRTSGIEVQSSIDRETGMNITDFSIQILVQGFILTIFGSMLVIVSLIVFWKCKDHQKRKNRESNRIMKKRQTIFQTKYVQVNTFEPPPPRISNAQFQNLPAYLKEKKYFATFNDDMNQPLLFEKNKLKLNAIKETKKKKSAYNKDSEKFEENTGVLHHAYDI